MGVAGNWGGANKNFGSTTAIIIPSALEASVVNKDASLLSADKNRHSNRFLGLPETHKVSRAL